MISNRLIVHGFQYNSNNSLWYNKPYEHILYYYKDVIVCLFKQIFQNDYT